MRKFIVFEITILYIHTLYSQLKERKYKRIELQQSNRKTNFFLRFLEKNLFSKQKTISY